VVTSLGLLFAQVVYTGDLHGVVASLGLLFAQVER
jgi:hypothetical protein